MINNFVSPILGAIIGYFTNWLAIKMLFLPYEPKYIGKFKIPFTPGLIPKERKKISKKIANITAEKILDKHTIEENLFSTENKEKMYILLERNLDKLREKNYTLDDILQNIYGDKKEKILDEIEQFFLSKINQFIFDEKNKKILTEVITNKIYENIKNKDIKENIKNIIIEYINKQDIKENIGNKKLSDIISKEEISNIKINIIENVPKICEYICYNIENNKEWEQKLSVFIKNIIADNVGTFTGLFLNPDKIYMSIKKNIIIYLKNKENQNILAVKIFEVLSAYQDKTLFEIYKNLPEKTKNIIKEHYNNTNLTKYVDNLKIFDSINDIIDNNINTFIEKLLSDNILKNIYEIIENYIKNNKNKIYNIKINIILDKICIEKFKDDIFNLIQKFIDKERNNILNNISISDIIENKINSFDVKTLENLVVSVARKELNAITIIGGILGFIIGFIPIILK
ncbi:DUF445 family protein [[Clostridium] colinum]|uniref:DUF445 family protein n=1 Tax=[Clostridium] colinum TaxID=36835 RepID=UPI0020248639|nr:DUF445 family protein [[Clostridium] colinum]